MRLTPEQQALVTEHARIGSQAAWHVVRTRGIHTYDRDAWDMDDVICAANEGLCDAAMAWDPERGDFGGYAQMIVRHRVLDFFRQMSSFSRRGARRRPLTMSIDAVRDTEDESTWHEILADPNDSGTADVSSWDNITWLLGKLPPRERQIAWLVHVEGRTLTDVGKMMGISPSRASQIHARAMTRLRRDIDVWKAA